MHIPHFSVHPYSDDSSSGGMTEGLFSLFMGPTKWDLVNAVMEIASELKWRNVALVTHKSGKYLQTAVVLVINASLKPISNLN